ncbi:MAG TPA: hypothetical protein EYN67_00480 [Flavobacteriales bacterium]|nr:hypothetical protein [Flavobacteriales bacterium]
MVNTGELEHYLNARSASKGDIVTIVGEGEIAEIPQKNDEVRKGLNIPVQIKDRKLIWSPGKMALRPIQATWGLESKNWVGKKGRIDFIKTQAFGETKEILILEPMK